jgi:hypothetical protein
MPGGPARPELGSPCAIVSNLPARRGRWWYLAISESTSSPTQATSTCSSVLVRSIQHVNPDIPIMIIPGEGFDHHDHPFEVPIMPQPAGFWAHMGYMDRCFWAFQGPFENFLYLDADMICTKWLENLKRRITEQQGNFIYVHPSISDKDWLVLIHDPHHPKHQKYAHHVKREIGRGPLNKFDLDYNIFANRPFNAGLFASRLPERSPRDPRSWPLRPAGIGRRDAALARAIEQVLDAPPPAARLRARAELFSVDGAVDRLLQLLFPDQDEILPPEPAAQPGAGSRETAFAVAAKALHRDDRRAGVAA